MGRRKCRAEPGSCNVSIRRGLSSRWSRPSAELMRLALAFALFFVGAQAASAAADPCAKFSDADAYNNGLARSGPLAGEHKVTRAPQDENRHAAPRANHISKAAPPRDGLMRKA